MNIEILREAEEELREAIAYYEKVEPGLGIRLKEEARAVIERILNNPEMPSLRAQGYRRVNFNIFRHYVAYFIWNGTIWVVAIAHAHQRPEYWLERKKTIE